jgi:hypothetical protein
VPRFVILEHSGSAVYKPGIHWDLMLEVGSSLRTWELERPPAEGIAIQATELAIHRLDYLDYEGPVSGNRGSVRRWDSGTYFLNETPAELVIAIQGGRIGGKMLLQRDIHGGGMWSLRFMSDLASSAE